MKDGLLELAIAAADADTPDELAVTLIIGGLLVSGHVIGREKYWKHHPFTEFVANTAKAADAAQGNVAPDHSPEFLYLRDARYFAPGQPPIPTDGSVVCRLSLDAIQGFNFGTLGVGPVAK